jgi:fatty-acyl-CoA synthase
MVFPDEGFDADSTLAAVTAERCTALYGVPTMFVSMLESKQFSASAMHSLRTGIMAGAPCPEAVMRRVMDDMNMREVTIAYGMTETSPVSMQNHVDDPLQKRVATVGRIHPHAEVKIIDSNGRVMPVGQSGELCTRGYLVMQGYWNDAERTQQSIDAAGWMHSGDLAVIDGEGFCSIVGRVKDMLIRGGENIYPREIEELLFTHQHIQQAQVFGVPDDRLGERICAWVVLNPGASLTETELQAWCRERMAIYKVPEYVRFKTELPMTATGKPQKFIMRDAMIKELGAAG